jgi:predicted flap endonuclease-1-like 5' DNA nuclease
MSDASAGNGDLVRSFVIWLIALVGGLLLAWIIGGLFGYGAGPGLIFGALLFIVLPYLVPAGASPASWRAKDAASHGGAEAQAHHPAAPQHDPLAAATTEPEDRSDAALPEPVMFAGDIVLPEQPVEIVDTTTPEPEPPARPAAPLDDLPGEAAPPHISERVREAARAARAALGDMLPAERPAALDAPRAGGADDLKRIKGVGPKIETLLHSLGIYHFDQIAAWGPAEVAWMDSNLEGFPGRVTRDDWVGQSKLLREGGATEFAQRADRGEVC